ncbi:MAG: N-6 DNA methylase [Paludibacteraceae bacterium]
MAFNRKAKFRDNIEAIRTVFELDKAKRQATSAEKEILSRYCGFGGLKCILNPANDLSDTVHWVKSDLELFPMTVELHQIIRSNSTNEAEYKRYMDSMKSSVLTAFYTPTEIVSALSDTLHEHGVSPQRLLDPSAGQGVFIEAFDRHNPHAEVMAFEKDLLTGKVLTHLYPGHNIRVEGFEKMELPFNGYFDVVSSNIPFGDIAVFDPVFSGSKNNARRQSARAIHNYFFAKGLDSVREGGIVAFITSQGVMNVPQYEAQRRLLLENADLISAIRLPNNLFTETANTEVGSDLIVLQKHSGKEQLSSAEQAFLTGYITSSGTISNLYFQDGEHIVYTKRFLDTDPYGKPAMIYLHEGGAEGMAADLRRMLALDFSQRLDKSLFERFSQSVPKAENSRSQKIESTHSVSPTIDKKTVDTIQTEKEKQVIENKPEIEQPVMSLYDLFGFSEEEKRIAQTGGSENTEQPIRQVSSIYQRSTFLI